MIEYIFSTQDYAKDIAKDFNKIWYSNLIFNLGDQLNSRKDRFDKSDLIEQAITTYSNGRFKWVDDIGRDIFDTKWQIDIEIKYGTDVIYTKTKKPKSIIKLKIKNSLGSNKGISIKNPAEYYIVCQQDAMGIISYQDLRPHLVAVSDGIESRLPFDKLEFVFKPSDISKIKKIDISINYKDKKAEMQRNIINQVMNYV